MLKVKFMQIENVVVMKVLEQSKKDTEILKEDFNSQNGMCLRSCEYPEISDSVVIYLRGKDTNNDTLYTSYSFGSIDNANEFINNAKGAINEFNEKFKSLNDEKDEEVKIYTIIAQ